MKLKYLALAGLLGFTACDDVIDLKPLDSFTDESYWTSVARQLFSHGPQIEMQDHLLRIILELPFIFIFI